jgi:phosphotransferase system IIB component
MQLILNIYFISSSWLKQNYWWLLLVLLVIVALAIKLLTGSKKVKTVDMADELITEIIDYFGGTSNLKSASKDGSRLRITVVDVKKCQLEEIKNLGATGVFVTGNQVKLMFPFPVEKLVEKINSI